MREIKFRAWHKTLKTYVEVLAINFESKIVHCNHEGKLHSFNFGEIILEQYTGLKDKKGKEVYDGDTLAFTNKWEWYRGSTHDWYEKTLEEKTAWLAKQPTYTFNVEYDAVEGYSSDIPEHYEVIGNMHEREEE
jgi:uncharacterized phage protein (TIGR01671 family)